MERRWTVSEIAKETRIPENTVRRYTQVFEQFLTSRRSGRALVYDDQSVTTIRRISELYGSGHSTRDIEAKLAETIVPQYKADVVECDEELKIDLQQLPPQLPLQLMAMFNQFETLKEQMAATQTALEEKDSQIQNLNDTLQKMDQEQKIAVNELYQSINKRDEVLMQTVRTMMREQKERSRPWWKRLF